MHDLIICIKTTDIQQPGSSECNAIVLSKEQQCWHNSEAV